MRFDLQHPVELSPGSPSPIDFIESVYHLGGGDDAWLDRVVCASGALDRGLGVIGVLQRYADGAVETIHAAIHGPRETVALARRVRDVDLALEHLAAAPLVHSSSLRAELERSGQAASLDALAGDLGVVDIFGHMARVGAEWFVAILAPSRAPIVPPPVERRRWGRMLAHLGTGLRLRRRLSAQPEVPEVVLEPDGTPVSVAAGALEGDVSEREALDHLGARVRTLERARGDMRLTPPDGATSLWRALVDGRWSLADHVDRAGKRFVVAFRNELGAPGPRELSPRERDVAEWAAGGASLKQIGYALGVSVSTVGEQLASAMRKLRVTTRAELAMFWRAAQARAPAGHDIVRLALDPDDAALVTLTVAERDVARRAARGETTAAIARARGVAESTITNQLGAIYRKLALGSRAELAALLAGNAGRPRDPKKPL
ncbi:MAG: hypothetical protein IT385_23870 [Deltaproteobacteria bacterium]|nr:hypothetical protein [Deltaproteobacteria bacterium]